MTLALTGDEKNHVIESLAHECTVEPLALKGLSELRTQY